MKRSEMLLKLERTYHIRHCMVEAGHLSITKFIDELLSVVEDAGMKPPATLCPELPEWESEIDFCCGGGCHEQK